MTFAVFEEGRMEWMKHETERNGKPPTAGEVKRWYEQKPKADLLRAKGTAENTLKNFAETVVEEYDQEMRSSIEQEIISSKLQDLQSTTLGFGRSILASFIASFIFAALLIGVAAIVLNDPSPVEIGKELINK